jgi:hypothetical protein
MANTGLNQAASVTVDDRLEIYSDEPTGSGWLFFAGTVLGLAGIMRIIDGIWALRYHGALPQSLKDGVLGDNVKTYGWVWIGVGALLVICSFLVLARSQFARWVGIFAAAVLTITAMAWMPYYTGWSIMYVAIGGLVIYALAAHGGREPRRA